MSVRMTQPLTLVALFTFLAPAQSRGACHLWQIKEVFSNQSGDIQYIELFNASLSETATNTTTLTTNSDGNVRTFTLSRNLTGNTSGKHLLFATPGFANLAGGVTPDFTLPCGSFFDPTATSITVTYSCSADSITFAGASLPADGANSLTDQNVGAVANLQAGASSPTNFLAAAGSLSLSACLNDGSCNACADTLFCNGAEVCSGADCAPGADPCPFGCDEAGNVCLGCGDGAIDPGEDCDGADFGVETCASQGFVSGTLACHTDCTFDTSGCTTCGNNTLDAGEQCDGTELAGQQCASFGFDGGTLSCSPDCRFELGQCTTSEICGNGVAAGPEQCDGADLRDDNCQNRGFDSGLLACNASCRYDTSGCVNCACGDDLVCGAEVCDGTDLAGATCVTEGFDSGTLTCSGACQLDTSGCTTAGAVCGNNTQETGEECDDGNTTSGDGCSATCTDEAANSPSSDDSGCGCRSGEAAVPLFVLAAVALFAAARRRRQES